MLCKKCDFTQTAQHILNTFSIKRILDGNQENKAPLVVSVASVWPWGIYLAGTLPFYKCSSSLCHFFDHDSPTGFLISIASVSNLWALWYREYTMQSSNYTEDRKWTSLSSECWKGTAGQSYNPVLLATVLCRVRFLGLKVLW